MKSRLACVPLYLIDGLSYGEWDHTLQPFLSWLFAVKAPVIVLPKPRSAEERFNLAMAAGSIKEHARARGLIVLSEERLIGHQTSLSSILARRTDLVSPFSFIQVLQDGRVVVASR
jgi:hypothetical protein